MMVGFIAIIFIVPLVWIASLALAVAVMVSEQVPKIPGFVVGRGRELRELLAVIRKR